MYIGDVKGKVVILNGFGENNHAWGRPVCNDLERDG